MKRKHPTIALLANLALIQIGAFIVSVGLEEFLIPNKLLDGGVVGVSIIFSFLLNIPLGALLVAFNIPFIILSFRHLGLKFVLLTIYAIVSLSVWVSLFNPIKEITNDTFLSAIFGGIFVGFGVGLIIRNGGCLDGTEIVSIILSKRFAFTVGEIVMFLNLFIFTAAGFIFGIEKALYSIVAYLLAYKLIDLVITGINQSHSLFIVTQKPEEVSEALMEEFGTGVTILKGLGGFTKTETDIIYLVIGRLEINKAKEIIIQKDADAFITIQNVQEKISKKGARLLR